MREINSTQRRRRLRLIKAEDEQTDDRFRSAASILAPASNTEAARFEVERIHRRMMMECRAKTGTRIRIEFPGEETQIVTMNQPYLLIGSDPHCDLRLEHQDVNPQHIYLQWVNGQIFWCDLSPREGTDQRQQTNGKWFNNDPINIGPYRLSLDNFELPLKVDESPLDRSSQLSEELPQLAFQFVGVEQSENLWSVNRVLTIIGRGSQCKLRLNHASMPYVQACLLRTRHCCWLVDIEGTGTTGVNGRAITVAPIDIGDILQLGPFRVEVVTKSIPKQDLSASGRTTKLHNSRKVSELEAPGHAQFSEVTSKAESSAIKNQSPEQSLTTKSRTPMSDELVRVRSEPSIKKPLVNPDVRSEVSSNVAQLPRVGSNSAEVQEKKQVVAEEGRCQPISNSDASPKSESTLLPTVALKQSIATLIKAHEIQLTVLKSQLERIKQVYEKPRSQSISKHARLMLDKTMRETMKTHELMYESIKQLTQIIK